MGCVSCKFSGAMLVTVLAAGAVVLAAELKRDGNPASPPSAPVAPNEPAAQPSAQPAPEAKPAPKPDPYVLGFTVKDIEGKDQELAQYKGKVVLIVNVASECGFTPQYEALQKLYADKKDAGLVVLGFPANNFGSQEPGTDAEIKAFCTSKYSVTFPMFAKISVKGPDQHPLYKKLASQPEPVGGDPGWNFTKYLVDRSGNVVQKFGSRVKPDESTLSAKLEELLKAK